jgi:hypothetical protein
LDAQWQGRCSGTPKPPRGETRGGCPLGAVEPPWINKAAAANVGSSLVARKLILEIRSKPGMTIWREENRRNVSLVITRAGRDAIRENDSAESDRSATKKNSVAVASEQSSSLIWHWRLDNANGWGDLRILPAMSPLSSVAGPRIGEIMTRHNRRYICPRTMTNQSLVSRPVVAAALLASRSADRLLRWAGRPIPTVRKS